MTCEVNNIFFKGFWIKSYGSQIFCLLSFVSQLFSIRFLKWNSFSKDLSLKFCSEYRLREKNFYHKQYEYFYIENKVYFSWHLSEFFPLFIQILLKVRKKIIKFLISNSFLFQQKNYYFFISTFFRSKKIGSNFILNFSDTNNKQERKLLFKYHMDVISSDSLRIFYLSLNIIFAIVIQVIYKQYITFFIFFILFLSNNLYTQQKKK
jgi:hypothetical protein